MTKKNGKTYASIERSRGVQKGKLPRRGNAGEKKVLFYRQLGSPWEQEIETDRSGFSKENDSGRLVGELEHEERSWLAVSCNCANELAQWRQEKPEDRTFAYTTLTYGLWWWKTDRRKIPETHTLTHTHIYSHVHMHTYATQFTYIQLTYVHIYTLYTHSTHIHTYIHTAL